jgi:hypothetical protein
VRDRRDPAGAAARGPPPAPGEDDADGERTMSAGVAIVGGGLAVDIFP